MAERWRVGQGVDFHRYVSGRPLVIGGVQIDYERGLEGHSDADVLAHAVADALLGAASLGDIGIHFPAEDPAYEGISSLALLESVSRLLEGAGYRIEHIDATVVAEAPKLAEHFEAMRSSLARPLAIDAEAINLKATRPERLGALGRMEGVMALAIAQLASIDID